MTVRIGDRGRTSTILKPGGFVTVAGDRHPARCLSGFVDASTEVVIVGGDNLGLIVREVASAEEILALPRHGEVVHSSFGAKIGHVGKDKERRRHERRQRTAKRAWVFGGICGLICSLTAAFLLKASWHTLAPDQPWLVPGMLTVLGIIWGLIVGRCLCGAFEQFEHHRSLRLTYTATIMTLAGTTAALVYVMPVRGVWVGLATALSTTVILGAALPALALVGEWAAGTTDEGTSPAESADEPGID